MRTATGSYLCECGPVVVHLQVPDDRPLTAAELDALIFETHAEHEIALHLDGLGAA